MSLQRAVFAEACRDQSPSLLVKRYNEPSNRPRSSWGPNPEGAFAWLKFRRSESKTRRRDRKSTRLNSSHVAISYAVFCLKKKKKQNSTSKRTSNFKNNYHEPYPV